MSEGPQAARIEGDRLHLHHGPIDLIIDAEGEGREAAFAAGAARFETVLSGLTAELPTLTARYLGQDVQGPVARRMALAVAPLADRFITPMAAVAGAVAEEILAAICETPGLTKAHVNNGGDIAFYLTSGEFFRTIGPTGTIEIAASDPVRGIATSGWRGRSLSFGIADAVTVLATGAARADAAATLIANAVDLPGHAAIDRQPASEIEAIPQLGDRLVTTGVGPLHPDDISLALAGGLAYAETLIDRDLILAAALQLGGEIRTLSAPGPRRFLT
jgi:hypothetical protein